ncbi:tetratricopeptide repeat protein [Arthrospira platensis NCB002]|nr:CHAT domain-containing protein [Arthrospira platensis]MDF2213416.1 tetratricopeptide repeat protein [Arthrospira platensis NCB002]BAI91731.1 TPR domain protein [Arthrospira platensis NIES-39]
MVSPIRCVAMDEERSQAYLSLIQELLECPSGEEPQILKSHLELLDEGFVQVCEWAAAQFQEAEHNEEAEFVRNVARRIGVFLAQGAVQPSQSEITPAEYKTFLQEALRLTRESGFSPSVVYPFLDSHGDKLNQDLIALIPAFATSTNIATLFSFANLVQQFPRGQRAINLEIAITIYTKALDFFDGQNNGTAWATIQNILGNAYLYRLQGERAENIEEAIRRYQAALEVYAPSAYLEEWAMTQNNLGEAYRNRIRGERGENLERAIGYYEAALEVRTRSAYPEQWAMSQNNLGNAYLYRIQGEQAENLDQAIGHYAAALEVYTLSAYPEDWADTQNNLGNAYSDRIRGERSENIEQAIACYEAALEVRTRSAFPEDWADTQNNLGLAYWKRIRGERGENIERAIRYSEAAFEIYTPSAYPEKWAMSQNNLGLAYLYRIRGERADNLELAIRSFEGALEVRTSSACPEQWAEAQNNLAIAYSNRIRGKEAENQERAIGCLEAALEVYTSSAYPEKWAMTQNNLGEAYRNRIRGEEAGNQERAIGCLEAALEVYTSSAYPEKWAITQNNLGNAYCQRIQGERAENIERAIACYEAALEVRTRNAFPQYWARTQHNLAIAYSHRIRGELADNIEEAIRCFQAALEVFTPSAFPLNCLETGRNLGNLGYDLQNWEIAIEGYNQAILAIEQSRYWATSEATKRELIANSLDIYQKMVQACINHQDYPQALLTVERSKSRTLLELLDSANLYPKNATDAQKQRISDLRRQIASYQQQLAYTSRDTLTPATEKHPNQPSPETLIRQQLQAANQQFQDLLTELDDPNFTLTQQVPAQLPDLRRLLPPQTALIEWYLPREAESGFYAFLVTRRDEQIQITPHPFSAEDRQHLDQALQDYRSDYGKPSWNQQLPQRLETLSGALQLPRLLAELSEIQHLILIPHRELHLIPLHALPVSLPSPSGGEGKPLQDWFPVQYAPSCQILNNLQQRPPLNRETVPFFAIQNPTEDLDYAEWGVELLLRQFSPHQVLRRDQATRANLTQPHTQTFLEQSHAVHFGCHGEFDEANPLNAYLKLANGEKLTFLEIFNGLNIPLCRLLVLSACKTGLVETSHTDDYVGLSSAFFYAGARTVVASLWNVDELAATLVTLRLYQILPDYPSVTVALQAAQTWLRGLSSAEILDWLKHEQKATEEEVEEVEDRLSLFDDNPPFANAYYWSAFTAIGN